ncbi:MAG: phosphotransferase [Pseudonocardiales bacterium]
MQLDARPAIVKQVVGDADRRFARELNGLRIAARAEWPVAPALLGADSTARLMVLENLTAGPSAQIWPVAYASALAGLHATLGSADGLDPWAAPTPADVGSFLQLAGDLGVRVPHGAAEELTACLARVTGWPHDALLHGDPCPDNAVHTTGGVCFVDFEGAAAGPGLIELAYLRMGFPTCWCAAATPELDLLAAEAAYQQAWTAQTGRAPAGTLADACVSWVIRGDALVERDRRAGTDHLAAAARSDWKWGTATARQRLKHRLEVVAAVTETAGDLGGVHALATAMTEQVAACWPALPPLPSLSTVRI